MAWDREVPGCFGHADKIFARCSFEEGRAFAWLAELRKRGTTLADAERQVRAYLTRESCGKAHIREQLERLQAWFGPWLP